MIENEHPLPEVAPPRAPGEPHPGFLRDYEVAHVNCIVTKRIDRCIVVPLGEFETQAMTPEGAPQLDAEGKPILVSFTALGQFSAAGLRHLLTMLEETPEPVKLQTPEEVRAKNPYQWLVILRTGQRIYQYPEEGGESAFASVHIPDVAQFWIVPKPGHDLPAYGLAPEFGFVRVMKPGGEMEPLNLPWPGLVPFWYQYERRVWRNFQMGMGQIDEAPAYVKQILGWRYEEAVFEISIEEDGSFQPHTKEPLDHPLFQKNEEARRIDAGGPVRIVDPIGV